MGEIFKRTNTYPSSPSFGLNTGRVADCCTSGSDEVEVCCERALKIV